MESSTFIILAKRCWRARSLTGIAVPLGNFEHSTFTRTFRACSRRVFSSHKSHLTAIKLAA